MVYVAEYAEICRIYVAEFKFPNWKFSHRLSERLESLGKNESPIEGPLKPLRTIVLLRLGVSGEPSISPSPPQSPVMPTDASLSDRCKPDRCSFSSLGILCVKLKSIFLLLQNKTDITNLIIYQFIRRETWAQFSVWTNISLPLWKYMFYLCIKIYIYIYICFSYL